MVIYRNSLQFVHIGKCGGSTLLKLLKASPYFSNKYQSIYESHINGVKINSDCDYLFCLRNPLSRALSAFEWRKKLVVLDQVQKLRFPGEYEILTKYSSFSSLCENLYFENQRLNQEAARDFRSIHHLRESISFYLKPLQGLLNAQNVLGVVCQEVLEQDCKNILNLNVGSMSERKNFDREESIDTMSKQAKLNAKSFLHEDYSCITYLWSSGIIDDEKFKLLLF